MIIEYVSVRTDRVLDRITGDRVDRLRYETGRARDLVEDLTRRLPADRAMDALSDWSNGYVALRRVSP